MKKLYDYPAGERKEGATMIAVNPSVIWGGPPYVKVIKARNRLRYVIGDGLVEVPTIDRVQVAQGGDPDRCRYVFERDDPAALAARYEAIRADFDPVAWLLEQAL